MTVELVARAILQLCNTRLWWCCFGDGDKPQQMTSAVDIDNDALQRFEEAATEEFLRRRSVAKAKELDSQMSTQARTVEQLALVVKGVNECVHAMRTSVDNQLSLIRVQMLDMIKHVHNSSSHDLQLHDEPRSLSAFVERSQVPRPPDENPLATTWSDVPPGSVGVTPPTSPGNGQIAVQAAGAVEAGPPASATATPGKLRGGRRIKAIARRASPPAREVPKLVDDCHSPPHVCNPYDLGCKVVDASYQPEDFTFSQLLQSPFADPQDLDSISADEWSAWYRQSCTQKTIDFDDDGRPMNPFMRTGLRGRLNLLRWGVNQAVDVLVTRWRRDSSGAVMERGGKRVLEFLAIFQYGMWSIPGGMVRAGEKNVTETQKAVFERKLLRSNAVAEKDRSTVRELQNHARQFPQIYSNDPRNTDNAWVETTAAMFHDDTGAITRLIKFDSSTDMMWLMVHRGVHLFASHSLLLEMAAESVDAFFE